MDDSEKKSIKETIDEIYDILLLVRSCLNVLRTLFKNYNYSVESDMVRQNEYFGFSIFLNWRVCVLELSKLYPNKAQATKPSELANKEKLRQKNNHFALDIFVQSLKNATELSNLPKTPQGLWQIESDINSLYEPQPVTNRNLIERLNLQRSKKIAHTDGDRDKNPFGTDSLTLGELILIAETGERVIDAIHKVLFTTSLHFGFIIGDAGRNLDNIIVQLADTKRAIYRYQADHCRSVGIDPKEMGFTDKELGADYFK